MRFPTSSQREHLDDVCHQRKAKCVNVQQQVKWSHLKATYFCVLFVNKVKKLSPGSQSGALQSPIYNVGKRSVHCVLPVKHNICNLSAFRRAPPTQLSFATRTPDEYMHFATVVRDFLRVFSCHQPSNAEKLPPKQGSYCLR